MSGKTNYEKFIFSHLCLQKGILTEKEHPLMTLIDYFCLVILSSLKVFYSFNCLKSYHWQSSCF